MIIVPASSSLGLASKVAKEMGSALAETESKRFPDGEMYVRIATDLKGAEVAVVGNTRSDSDVLELMLLLNAAREAGASGVTAVLPYFGYSRQHMIYRPGEPVSSKVLTKALENFSDRIICVEIHDEETIGFANHPFRNISVIGTSSEYFRDRKIDLVLSPDDGGYERAKKMAGILSIPAYYIDKKRIDSRTVEMHLPDVDFKGKSVLLVDDIISTGGTIIKAAKLLKDSGASKISVSAVHGIFARDSDRNIEPLVDHLAVSDTIEGSHSLISVAGDISRALKGDE